MRTTEWNIGEWRCSPAYTDLTAEAQGLHRALIDLVLWEDDGVPFDPIGLCLALGISAEEWQRAWPSVRPFWELRDGRLFLTPAIRRYVRRAHDDATDRSR